MEKNQALLDLKLPEQPTTQDEMEVPGRQADGVTNKAGSP